MAGKGQKIGKAQGVQVETEINWKQVEALCQILCTNEEIAAVVGCDRDTLNNHSKKYFKKTFSEWASEKRENGKASLRRAQYKSAVDNLNPTSLIWLGKQYLGQSDKIDNRHELVVPTIKRDVPALEHNPDEVIEHEDRSQD